jgi:hypothetical protein
MSKTCGKCHSVQDRAKPLITGKIHATLAEDRHWVPGIIEKLYTLLIVATMGFFLTYIIMDIIRNVRLRRSGKKGGGH